MEVAGEQHQFLTVEYSTAFLERHLTGHEAALQPVVRRSLRQERRAAMVAPLARLPSHWRKSIERLRLPPVTGPAAALWYQSKALELMAECFFLQCNKMSVADCANDRCPVSGSNAPSRFSGGGWPGLRHWKNWGGRWVAARII